MVRLTPKGLSVSDRQRRISASSASGVGWVSAVMKPRAPAFATAATSSARPTHCMPPWVMGCSTPNISVNGVEIMACLRAQHVCESPIEQNNKTNYTTYLVCWGERHLDRRADGSRLHRGA